MISNDLLYLQEEWLAVMRAPSCSRAPSPRQYYVLYFRDLNSTPLTRNTAFVRVGVSEINEKQINVQHINLSFEKVAINYLINSEGTSSCGSFLTQTFPR
jgi:hypothetical protein